MTKETPSATTTKQEESKADKFKRIGAKRTSNALDAIAAIGGLAAKNNYEYTPEQVTKIIGAIEAETQKLKDKFSGTVALVAGFEL